LGSFWHFQKEQENKEKEQEKMNSQNIGFSSSFWTAPMKELQKGKCNIVTVEAIALIALLVVGSAHLDVSQVVARS